jgi:hypothetical protein
MPGPAPRPPRGRQHAGPPKGLFRRAGAVYPSTAVLSNNSGRKTLTFRDFGRQARPRPREARRVPREGGRSRGGKSPRAFCDRVCPACPVLRARALSRSHLLTPAVRGARPGGRSRRAGTAHASAPGGRADRGRGVPYAPAPTQGEAPEIPPRAGSPSPPGIFPGFALVRCPSGRRIPALVPEPEAPRLRRGHT